ncbi:MAG: 16S rRNA (uracil(1498)-N(3))-methyltransferase [Lachnospiraceae bacterium]|jgi:16S rRNA (uracil1498-N3)-methyltransferase|nr:16S rRNA (uracil(1498)-N(3))-methyltransferase [Lachnospiraceae bacterium]
MYQFFIEKEQIKENQVFITGADYNHAKNVLRLKKGEKFRISTKEGENYFCEISEFSDEAAVGVVLEKLEESTELKGRITLFQGLPKGDKMELIIQKAVELGAAEIVPVRMKNCVVKLDDKKAKAKVARWQAIAEAAAKQSKRSIIPQIHDVMDYRAAMEYAKENNVNLVPYENEGGISASKKAIGEIQPTDKVGIFIGPEGGFDEKEIEAAREVMTSISLGKRILRTETAAITAMSLVMMQMEE